MFFLGLCEPFLISVLLHQNLGHLFKGCSKLRTVASSVVVFLGRWRARLRRFSVNFVMLMTYKSFKQKTQFINKNLFYFVKLIYIKNYVKIWVDQPGRDSE